MKNQVGLAAKGRCLSGKVSRSCGWSVRGIQYVEERWDVLRVEGLELGMQLVHVRYLLENATCNGLVLPVHEIGDTGSRSRISGYVCLPTASISSRICSSIAVNDVAFTESHEDLSPKASSRAAISLTPSKTMDSISSCQ